MEGNNSRQRRNMRQFWGLMKLLFTKFVVVDKWFYTFVKTHRAGHHRKLYLIIVHLKEMK